MATPETVFSNLRDSILKNMTADSVVPVNFYLEYDKVVTDSNGQVQYREVLDPKHPPPNAITENGKVLEPVTVKTQDTKFQDTARDLGLTGNVYARVLPIDLRNELSSRLPEGRIAFTAKENTPLLGWTIANGIVDPNHKPIFDPADMAVIVGKFTDICVYLAWEVLAANGMTVPVETGLVGNSERTDG